MKQSVARVTPLFQMCVRCTHSIIQKHTQSASHDTSYASMNRNRASKLTIDSEIRVTTNQLFSIRLHVYNGVHHLTRYGYERQRYRFHIRLWIWMWMRDLCVKSRFNSFFDMAFGIFLCSFGELYSFLQLNAMNSISESSEKDKETSRFWFYWLNLQSNGNFRSIHSNLLELNWLKYLKIGLIYYSLRL